MVVVKNSSIFKKILAFATGLILFIVLAVIGFRIFGTRAADFEPRDVVISNIEKNSARISWATGVETQGIIEYGTSPTALNFFAPEPTKEKNHSVDLTLLSPSTTYYFIIRIADKRYDNGGVPWSFTTKGIERSQPSEDNMNQNNNSSSDIQQNNQVTPIQRLRIDNSDQTPSLTESANSQINPTPTIELKCDETDNCDMIKDKLGKGCNAQDYYRCLLKKTTPSPSP